MSFMRGRKQSAANGFPKPGEELVDVASRHTREGWTEVAVHTSVVLHGKQYRNMREWARPCTVCGAAFTAFESANRSDANSQFSNKTCQAHRGLLPAIEKGYIAWSKELNGMVPSFMCVTQNTPEGGGKVAELEKELAAAYEANAETAIEKGKAVREVEALKAKLAKYELPAALEAAKNIWG